MGQTRAAASKALALMAIPTDRKKPPKLTPAQIAKERARAEISVRLKRLKAKKRKGDSGPPQK